MGKRDWLSLADGSGLTQVVFMLYTGDGSANV